MQRGRSFPRRKAASATEKGQPAKIIKAHVFLCPFPFAFLYDTSLAIV